MLPTLAKEDLEAFAIMVDNLVQDADQTVASPYKKYKYVFAMHYNRVAKLLRKLGQQDFTWHHTASTTYEEDVAAYIDALKALRDRLLDKHNEN